jgi:hypothetical protein
MKSEEHFIGFLLPPHNIPSRHTHSLNNQASRNHLIRDTISAIIEAIIQSPMGLDDSALTNDSSINLDFSAPNDVVSNLGPSSGAGSLADENSDVEIEMGDLGLRHGSADHTLSPKSNKSNRSGCKQES